MRVRPAAMRSFGASERGQAPGRRCTIYGIISPPAKALRRTEANGGQSTVDKKKINTLNLLGGILPVLATVALLGLWLYQQTGMERRARELAKLESARGVYQMYQSNNALFNAINEGLKERPQLSENLRRYQVYNYELGLRAIEDVLSPEEKKGIPAAPNTFSSVGNFNEQMPITQNRLEQLQSRLKAREKRAQDAVDSANVINLWLYMALSLVSVAGAMCQIMAMKSESVAETGAKS
jgi:hypothetical protein